MQISTRTRRLLIFFATAAGILLFWSTPLLYPLRIFVVLLHEASHALAAVATGGTIERIVLTPDEGGYALTRGGNAFLTLSAGYVGSMVWGAAILLAAGSRHARTLAVVLGAAVLALTLLYVRSLFGFAFGVLFGAAAVWGGRRLSRPVVAWMLQVVGLTSCLYAPLDIKSDILDRPELVSDARMLAEATHVPVLFWGVLWLGVSLAIGGWLFRRALARA